MLSISPYLPFGSKMSISPYTAEACVHIMDTTHFKICFWDDFGGFCYLK